MISSRFQTGVMHPQKGYFMLEGFEPALALGKDHQIPDVVNSKIMTWEHKFLREWNIDL